jgi:hypothetical protein
MSETAAFHPPRRRGILFHSTVILALSSSSALAFLVGMNQQNGTNFVLLLMISLIMFAPLPWVCYRVYALARASYRLERDGLRLRWGLRAEDIPLPNVEWVRRREDLALNLPLPRLAWPGAVLGAIQSGDLGTVEFLASTGQSLVLIATPHRVYAISPEDPDGFVRGFQRALEMGSLTPIESASVLPAAYASQLWADRAARVMLLGGLALTLLFFLGVGLAVPARAAASLGFYPTGTPLPPGPAAQMLLLPILGAFIFLADLATGVFFYRRVEQRPIAYLMWGSAVGSLLLLIAAALILLGYAA